MCIRDRSSADFRYPIFGASSVTITGLFSMFSRSFDWLAVNPSIRFVENTGKKLVSISVESKTDLSIPGSITLSSNCPACAAKETAVSFPITLKHIIFIHSASDGFTLPGIIEEPACTAGIPISDNPAIGPDAINLISFDIFPSSIAKFFNADDALAIAVSYTHLRAHET